MTARRGCGSAPAARASRSIPGAAPPPRCHPNDGFLGRSIAAPPTIRWRGTTRPTLSEAANQIRSSRHQPSARRPPRNLDRRCEGIGSRICQSRCKHRRSPRSRESPPRHFFAIEIAMRCTRWPGRPRVATDVGRTPPRRPGPARRSPPMLGWRTRRRSRAKGSPNRG